MACDFHQHQSASSSVEFALMKGPIHLVIFDCDGVLVDSESISVRTDVHVLANCVTQSQ